MPTTEPNMTTRLNMAEARLAQSTVDCSAKDAYIVDLTNRITELEGSADDKGS